MSAPKGAIGRMARSPLAKLGLWVVAMAACAAAVQGVAWLLGSDFHILAPQRGARTVLFVIGLGTLMALLQADHRPLSAYGLAVGDNWLRRTLAGLGLGLGIYTLYCAAAWACGALVLAPQSPSAYRWASALFAATLTALPIAAVQQVIFSGYLVSRLRDRLPRWLAVAGSAGLFAALTFLHEPAAMLSQGRDLFTGMFLIGTLLALLRLRQGDITFSSGLLAGCIFVRRVIRKTGLLAANPESDLAAYLAPAGDPRQAPVLWGLLVAGIAAAVYLLARRGERQVDAHQPSISAAFKRVFPFSNLMALAPIDLWLGRLADARFRIGLVYVPRLIATLSLSAVNTLLTLPERLLAPWLLRHPVPPPVFIVGTHRSGTTHLHYLLAHDPQFCSPRNFQTMNPHGAMFCGWLLLPLLALFLKVRRPMDAVKMDAFTPQEEEHAIAGMCGQSPHWGLTFPRRVAHYDRYISPQNFSPRELSAWERNYRLFLQKVTFWSRKQPLLKSPYNTARVAALHQMFPQAKFIHICRRPQAVYRSNLHAVREGWVVFQLQDPDERDCYRTRFLDNYRAMEEAFERDAARLPPRSVARVRFEDLERDPIGQVRRLYRELGLEVTATFAARLQRYLATVADYQKNRHVELPEAERLAVNAKMGSFLARWGYADDAQHERQPKAA